MDETKPVLTPEQRRQRNRDEMTALILQAARDVMREQGAAALNLQEVARRVGVRVPSLYNYFPSKIAIYDALFVMGMRMSHERLERVLNRYGATWEGVQRIMEDHLSFALENPELHQLLFERPVPGFEPSAAGLEEAAKLLEVSRRAANEAIASGMIDPPVSAEVIMNLFIAIIHGFTSQHLANEPHLPLGSGRFGSLIPLLIDLLRAAWGKNSSPEA